MQSKDELNLINNNKTLIICFGGLMSRFAGIPPFEFLNYLSSLYTTKCDLIFYIDRHQCWYHKGIAGITNNIVDTVRYLNNTIQSYNKVIFMGSSAGGYAAILFGSLCNHVDDVIAFIPQTILSTPVDTTYRDLRTFMNTTTNFQLIGDLSEKDIKSHHHIRHCIHLQQCKNVHIVSLDKVNLKELRDSGFIKRLLDNIIDVTT